MTNDNADNGDSTGCEDSNRQGGRTTVRTQRDDWSTDVVVRYEAFIAACTYVGRV